MNFFVYILYSPSHNRTYTGQSDNLDNRLVYHNSGKVRSTKPYRPWELIYIESFPTRAQAMKREKWFKSKAGRKKIAKILNEYLSKHSN
ncbi:MAG: GIY-YIG nuclease family protein [Ignavibacteria bacterium]|nr:GIY-YIG nuclease family protein [Ignavibacteria bacterium]